MRSDQRTMENHMAKPKKDAEKKLEIPANFPQNVEPTEANVKAFNEQAEKDAKAREDGEEPEFGTRMGEGTGDPEVYGTPDDQTAVRQTKTASE